MTPDAADLTISRDFILVGHIDGMLESLENRGTYTLRLGGKFLSVRGRFLSHMIS